MARPLRLHVPGMVYHVMSRGNAKQAIFTDDVDYARYLALLERAAHRFGVRCLAHCLMANHTHLLLKPDEHPIARMMQQVNGAFCQWFNRRHGRVGHVLQGRYKAVLVESDVNLLNVLRYIVLNPVAAGWSAHPAGWRWSSYRPTAGLDAGHPLLALHDVWAAFGAGAGDERPAHRRFADFIEAGVEAEPPRRALIVGSDAFTRSFEPMLAAHQSEDAFVYAERFAARPTLADLIPDITPGPALQHAARRAVQDYAFTLREVGTHVGRPSTTVWDWIRRSTRSASQPIQPNPR